MRLARLIALFVLVLQGSTTGMNGETWENQILLSAGQQVVLTWTDEYLSPGANPTVDSYKIYRQIGATGTISLLAQLSSGVREYVFTMPSGKTAEYRIRVLAIASDGTASPSSNEFLITRKK
jgi:hypothetical protein